MDGQAILTVSAAVVALTQLIKWGGVPDRLGPIAVLVLALIGVVFWGYSEGTFERTKAFAYFAGWVSVALSAAGVYGFTRATSEAITKTSPPPTSGAGSSPTVPMSR
jgi:hypothetical protein